MNTPFKHWDGIVSGYVCEMFEPSISRYSTRSQMALYIPLWTENVRQKSLPFLGPKIWSKGNPSIENVIKMASFTRALRKVVLLHLPA